MDFKLVSEHSPTGDQPEAIRQLVEGLNANVRDQVLLGHYRQRQDLYDRQCNQSGQSSDACNCSQ